jgi:zinc ribbon protein
MTTPCRKCGTLIEQQGSKFCPSCGAPISTALLVKHEDAIRELAHHESVLQNYRSMFLVSETFSVSLAATRLDNRGLVLLFSVFGISLLIVWIIVTTLRARVVDFFERHDEDGSLMQYHNLDEGVAHQAGFWFFTIVLPAMFALFWLSLILVAYGVITIG